MGNAQEKQEIPQQVNPQQYTTPAPTMGWPFSPCKFNANSNTWERVSQYQPQEQPPPPGEQQLKLLTFNVLFDDQNLQNRMKAIADIITSEDPDIIALQEVTPKICSILFRLSWVHKYYVSDPYGEELGKATDGFKYGNVLISKYNFHELYLRDFVSQQSRKALWGTILLPDGTPLCIGNFHLESYAKNHEVRKAQMELFQFVTSPYSPVILMGDSNMENDKEVDLSVNPDKFKEAWPIVKHAYETQLAGATYSSSFPTKRYDRVFFTDKTVEIVHFNRIGKDIVEGGTRPSDHLGIVFTVKRKF